jgi:CRISPR-associated protein Cas5
MDISILFQRPEKSVRSILTIEPLAPLSMVSTMPGNFYKTLAEPSKFHLCGAFENILGWHFDEKTRREIRKKVEASLKKQKFEIPDWRKSDVGYMPLVEHLVDIEPSPVLLNIPRMFYKDLWKQQRKRSDAYSHPKGTMNLSYEIIPLKMGLERDPDKGTVTDPAITDFYAEHRSQYPMYYSSAGSREFVVLMQGASYYYNLSISEQFFDMLNAAISENNIAYLGTNEGWVHLKIQRI